MHELEYVLKEHDKYVTVRAMPVNEMLQLAETREGRQHQLANFFREAYAKVRLLTSSTFLSSAVTNN